MTYQEGLIVKFLPSMEILQTRTNNSREYHQKVVDLVHNTKDESQLEKRRIITTLGTVIRYMQDGSIQLLFANGNYSIFDAKNHTWIKTKNSGERNLFKMDQESGKVLSVTPLET